MATTAKFANYVSFELERFLKMRNAVTGIRCPYNTKGGGRVVPIIALYNTQ